MNALATVAPTDLRSVKEITKPDPTPYNVSMGYLRAFVTMLVVAHHAVLAYHPFAPPPPASLAAVPRMWQAFPVTDPHGWSGFALFVGFNDIFFMSLMFFLSGLFVWKSLSGKGVTNFLRSRALRLGVPFLVAAAVIAPLAYFPAYLQTAARASGVGFWKQWLALKNWPAGPAWFVWVLLAFDLVAAGLFALAPRWGEVTGRWFSAAGRRPIVFFVVLGAVSAAAYLPLAVTFNSMRWTEFGPFFFQTSRVLHYLVYFLVGAAVGAAGIQNGLLAPAGRLARRWYLWVGGALPLFGLVVIIVIAAYANPKAANWELIGGCAFVLSCAALCLMFLSLFVRFVRQPSRWLDSLRDNAYGIYLIHYAIVSWLQYALLKVSLPGAVKGGVVFAGAVALSWLSIAALRRIPAVGRVI